MNTSELNKATGEILAAEERVEKYNRVIDNLNKAERIDGQVDLVIDNNKRGVTRLYLNKYELSIVLQRYRAEAMETLRELKKKYHTL
jgi:hypothetical protein